MARKSIIYNFSDIEFTTMAKESTSFAVFMRKLGLSEKGSNRETVRKRINNLNIDISHFKQGTIKGTVPVNKIPLEKILVENSTYQSNKLRKRLIKENILENKCYICGITKWNNKEITFHLDHINGNSFDNRLHNLRIICPNCDSQTEFYKGKNKRY